MTYSQLDTKVRENLNDWAVTYYDANDIFDSTQDAYDEIAVYCECIEKIVDIPVSLLVNNEAGAKPWTNVRSIINDYYRPIAILNRTTKQFLTPSIDRDNDDYRADWQLLNTGSVFDFIINGTEWIALPNGYFDINHKPLRMMYKASAPRLVKGNGNEIFKILTEYQKLLEYYVTADLLEQNQEFQKAMIYWKMYEPLLEEYRKKILLLSKSDRVFTRLLVNC